MKRFCIIFLVLSLLFLPLFSTSSLALNRFLRVGYNANLPPFQFLDENGESTGMHIDMLKAIGSERGYEFEFYPYDTNRECLDALESGKIDLLLGVILGSVPENRGISYSVPLTSSQLCMIVSNEPVQQNDRITTAVFSSDTVRHALLANLGIHQFIAVGNQRAVYERQRQNPDIAMIGVKDSLLFQFAEDGVDSDYTIRYNYLDTIEFAAVVRSDDVELLRVMNESIDRFKAGQQYENIYNKWLPIVDHEARLNRVFRMVIVISVIVAASVLFYSVVMRRIQQVLKRRVAEQTEQIQQANRELERQFTQIQDENDLRNRIIKYSPNGMLLFDRNYTVTLMNKSACAMAGLPEPPLGGSALAIPVFSDILLQEGDSVFVQGMTVESGGIRIGATPLHTRSFRYTMHQVIRFGSVEGILLSVQDMTKAERMQQAEFEKEKSSALTRIAAGIAHEIRNPLMAIRTFATLVGSKGDDKQVQESFSRYVPGEVDRINKLIENLIHYAKPAKRQAEQVCASEIVEESLALVRPVLHKNKFRLQLDLAAEATIFADRDQIKQVLVNILINSIEAMEQKAAKEPAAAPLTLEVRVAEADEKVSVTIRDNGVGMTEEELRICRDPFFSTKERGSGLGLALCEQYVKENNGTLEIDGIKNEYTQISLVFERS